MNIAKVQEQINKYAAENNIPTVDFKNKKLSLKLDAWSCHKARTGKCSLDLTEAELADERMKQEACGYAGKANYCPDLLKKMTNSEQFRDVYDAADNTALSLCQCGHYFVSGQHRICIAKRTNLQIPVNNISTSTVECFTCQGDKDYSLS